MTFERMIDGMVGRSEIPRKTSGPDISKEPMTIKYYDVFEAERIIMALATAKRKEKELLDEVASFGSFPETVHIAWATSKPEVYDYHREKHESSGDVEARNLKRMTRIPVDPELVREIVEAHFQKLIDKNRKGKTDE